MPELYEMIATEENGTTEEEILKFLQEKGHPAHEIGRLIVNCPPAPHLRCHVLMCTSKGLFLAAAARRTVNQLIDIFLVIHIREEPKMALTGIQILKMLPKKNCGECGIPTCLAFAMKVAAGQMEIGECPYVSDEVKETDRRGLGPPDQDRQNRRRRRIFTMGGETCLYRHEKRFENATGIGVLVTTEMSDSDLDGRIKPLQLPALRAGRGDDEGRYHRRQGCQRRRSLLCRPDQERSGRRPTQCWS
jgi:hypothetical protein